MKFSSSGTKSRASQKTGRKGVSAQAEACELRSLLSATVISVGTVDSQDLPMDGGEEASAKIDATEVDSMPGAQIDPDLTEIMPGDPGVDDAIFYCGVVDGDSGIPVEDPSEFIRFNTFFTSDDPGANDGTDGEKLSVEEEISFEDTPPAEGWDPSWLYRTLTSVAGDGSEEIIVEQGTGWEDGLGCGVAPDDFVAGDLTPNDFDGDGVPDDIVMYAFDPLPFEDVSGAPVDVIYFGGLNLEPVDGELAVEVDKPASDPNEEVDYVFDLLPLDDAAGEPVDVVEDGERVPIRTLESSDFDLSVMFYTVAPDGVELQRTNDRGRVQEETDVVSTVAIPVRPSSSNSLFSTDSGRLSVGIPVGVQSTSASGSNSSPAKRIATERRSSTQVTATRQSSESEGLNNLSPLLGGDAGPGENDSTENPVDAQPVESGSIEETISGNGNASSASSGFAANQNSPARKARTAMIDRVMSQYAENSFNS